MSALQRPTKTGCFLPRTKILPVWYLRLAIEQYPSLVGSACPGGTVLRHDTLSNGSVALPVETIWSALAMPFLKGDVLVGDFWPVACCIRFRLRPGLPFRLAIEHPEILGNDLECAALLAFF